MFKFSFNWLRAESGIEIPYNDLMKWLDEQGFEIESIEEIENDKIIEIEVKANRPDMLYVYGVLREFYASQNIPESKEADSKIKLDFSNDPKILAHELKILSNDVHRYCAVEIDGIDNTGESPDFIKERLCAMGVSIISPVVDISNYVLLMTGQPIHVFDIDKVKGAISVANAPNDFKYTTLAGKEIDVPKDALVISDEEAPLCLAGIIGAPKAEVDHNTKNIIIESANFDHIIERTTSKATHVSTAASYRFERGVDIQTSELGARLMAEMTLEICGGKLAPKAFQHYPVKYEPKVIRLTKARTNLVLGTNFECAEMAKYLARCFFKSTPAGEDALNVIVPDFRLDIEEQIDLIEEIGRMYGYHNIEPTPIKLYAPYRENPIHANSNRLRDIMVGYGFIEFLTFGFIPEDAMDKLLLTDKNCRYYGDIIIQNPLSKFYALMRPTMAYSMISSAIENLALGTPEIRIFEVGKTFFRDSTTETNYNERNVLSVLMTGTKHPKGFGLTKDQKYNVYDAVAAVAGVLDDYGFDYQIRNTKAIGFLDPTAGAEILVNGKVVGCVGQISKKVLDNFENGKLAKSDVLYFELDFDGFEPRRKTIKFETSFPGVQREYNFTVPCKLHAADYIKAIKGAHPFIVSADVLDVYQGQGVTDGTAAVLVTVKYNAVSRTLELPEIEEIEKGFLDSLKKDFGIEIRL